MSLQASLPVSRGQRDGRLWAGQPQLPLLLSGNRWLGLGGTVARVTTPSAPTALATGDLAAAVSCFWTSCLPADGAVLPDPETGVLPLWG